MTERKDTRFKPGTSGNPNGRAPGCGQVAVLREKIAEAVPGILSAMVKRAKEGDVGAARLLLERAIPPMKAVEQTAPITLPAGELSDQGRAIINAAASGELSPGQAAQMLQGLGALSKIIEVSELDKRITALEERNAKP